MRPALTPCVGVPNERTKREIFDSSRLLAALLLPPPPNSAPFKKEEAPPVKPEIRDTDYRSALVTKGPSESHYIFHKMQCKCHRVTLGLQSGTLEGLKSFKLQDKHFCFQTATNTHSRELY